MQVFENVCDGYKCFILVIDIVNGDVNEDIKKKISDKILDDFVKIMGLFRNLYIVEDLLVEICLNIDVEDGLINGIICLVKKLDFRVLNLN